MGDSDHPPPKTPQRLSTLTGTRNRRNSRLLAIATTTAAAAAMLVIPAAYAHAEPPSAIPANPEANDAMWQPAMDYDKDGCYATPAIGADGTIAEGLDTSGDLNGDCRDQSDLDNTNAYSRSKCDDSGWCAYLYDMYFEKDQAVPGKDVFGHRHDIEHIVVWVYEGEAEYVATSAHGNYDVHPRSEVQWDGTHPKIVYHKDGALTHCFRLAKDGEEPENHYGTWQYPDLVSWGNYPEGLRDKLTGADFGDADLGIKESAFADNLAKAKPDDIDFDPEG